MLSLVGYSESMSGEAEGWERLADLVRAARDALGLTSQAQLATAAGVAVGTVQRLEGGKPFPRLPNRTPAIERALGWPPGTARRIVEGEIAEAPGGAVNVAQESLEFARSMDAADEEIYRAALEMARSLSRAEKRRLLADLFDDAEPAVKSPPEDDPQLVPPRQGR